MPQFQRTSALPPFVYFVDHREPRIAGAPGHAADGGGRQRRSRFRPTTSRSNAIANSVSVPSREPSLTTMTSYSGYSSSSNDRTEA